MLQRLKMAFLAFWEALLLPVPPSVRALTGRLEALEEDHAGLAKRHRKLAGHVYGTMGGRGNEQEEQEEAHPPGNPVPPDPRQLDLIDLNRKIESGELQPPGGFQRGLRVS